MEFLKAILGDELYAQVEEKINAHNGNEANKDKLIKLANLGSGEYVGKGKYDSEIERLNNLLTGVTSERDAANDLISELKKGTKGNEELQGKVNTYETQTIPGLQAQLLEVKTKSALKIALLAEKAIPEDIDYLTYRVMENLKANGKTLEVDENENIKDWNDIRDSLKTQCPKQFESGSNSNKVDANPLPEGDDRKNTDPKTLADALRMEFEEK